MMNKCDNCKYRFKCLTTAEKKQPKIVRINRQISGNCGKCRWGKFKTEILYYYDNTLYKTESTGTCKAVEDILLIHKMSTCPKFEPKTKLTSKRVNKELDKVMHKKLYGSNLPKYCERED
jgi:hypothetical protein